MEPDGKEAMHSSASTKASTDSTSFSRWIGAQVVKLAAGWGEPMPAGRLAVYVENLLDFSKEQLEVVFARGTREAERFPSIPQLRALARSETKPEQSVAAMEGWEAALRYARKWGTDGLPVYVRGKGLLPPPALDARIEYALRRIGGLQALRDIAEEKHPFLLRDFCRGFDEAPVADLKGLLSEPFVSVPQLPEPERAPGEQPVSVGEIRGKLLEMAKAMPDAAPAETRTVSRRAVPPAVQLTPKQIEKRRDAERAEIERVRRQMEEA
jgi:hypothetical protein